MGQAVEHPTTRRAQSQTTNRRSSQAFAVLGICVIVIGKTNIAALQSLQSRNVGALALVENLGTATRQRVEIVRAVRQNATVFILDEPSASLTSEKTQHLFQLLNVLRERGAGIMFISHVLEEALDVADRIPALRGAMACLRGRPVRYRAPRQAVRDGIAYLTEDPKLDGFFETMTVDQNIDLGDLASRRVRRFLYSRQGMKRVANRTIETFSIPAIKRSLKTVECSGGNHQQVLVAKSLVQEQSVIIFDEPTFGVVRPIPQVRQGIRSLAAQGKAPMVISSYLPETLAISDQVLVARGGRIVEKMSAATATQAKIMYAAIH